MTQQNLPITEEQQEQENQSNFMLQQIYRNLQKGFETLEKKVEDLQEADLHPDPASEMRFRDLQSALAATLQLAEAQRNLLDILHHNMDALMEAMEMGKAHSLSNSGHIQNLRDLLVDKQTVTPEELATNWKEKIVPQFEQMGLTQPSKGN